MQEHNIAKKKSNGARNKSGLMIIQVLNKAPDYLNVFEREGER